MKKIKQIDDNSRILKTANYRGQTAHYQTAVNGGWKTEFTRRFALDARVPVESTMLAVAKKNGFAI